LDYYFFSKEEGKGSRPVNGTDWYYEGMFDFTMPDINLGSEATREEIKNIIVAGLSASLYWRFIVPSIKFGIKVGATILMFFLILMLVDAIDKKVHHRRCKKVLDKVMKEIEQNKQ
jgi:hypothetical protein